MENTKISGKAWGRVAKLSKQSDAYPHGVFFILGTEFCERFSYYGMRAILVIYLTNWLQFSGDTATACYHSFVVLCYITPLMGALLADGYIGKYKVILYLSILYAVGNVVMAFTALPPPYWLGPVIGLLLIGIGTGGIKPCVSAFGGDQFSSDQSSQLERFFSVFYFAINVGSLLSMLITPLLRAYVHCFDSSCYPLAFGVPAALMIVSTLVFYCGRNRYREVTPTGNILSQMVKCCWSGVRGRWSRPPGDKKLHWLDYASSEFDTTFIEDVKNLLKVMVLFIPLPVFWALFDQQGSRWTLQAVRMDGHLFGNWHMQPDQMQALNPILIIVCIPIFESFVYPALGKCGLRGSSLQRMCAGMLLTALSFVIAGILQIHIQQSAVSGLPADQSNLRFVNIAPCSVRLQSDDVNKTLRTLHIANQRMSSGGDHTFVVTTTADCGHIQNTTLRNVVPPYPYFFLVALDEQKNLIAQKYMQPMNAPQNGSAYVNIIFTTDSPDHHITHKFIIKSSSAEKSYLHFSILPLTDTYFRVVIPGSYQVETESKPLPGHVQMKAGGVYTVLIQELNGTARMMLLTDIAPSRISIFYQIPQYVLITVGEILFSISGLSFAYSQAPSSMKTVLSAAWLMTVAAGNVLDVVIIGSRWISRQDVEFFVFAALMGVTAIVFGLMGYFYDFVAPTPSSKADTDVTALVSDEQSKQYGTPSSEDSRNEDARTEKNEGGT